MGTYPRIYTIKICNKYVLKKKRVLYLKSTLHVLVSCFFKENFYLPIMDPGNNPQVAPSQIPQIATQHLWVHMTYRLDLGKRKKIPEKMEKTFMAGQPPP